MALNDLTGVDKFIDDFSSVDPEATDKANQIGHWLRGIQNVLLNQFPNLTAAATPTAVELNHLVGQDQGVGTGDSVEFTALDATPIGAATPAAGAFTSLDYTSRTQVRIASADSPYSASIGENILCECDAAIVINLPATPGTNERIFVRVDESCDSTNTVTLDPNGAATIGGETTLVVDLPFFESDLIADASDNWSF